MDFSQMWAGVMALALMEEEKNRKANSSEEDGESEEKIERRGAEGDPKGA